MINKDKYLELLAQLQNKATLAAVSKTRPSADILALYEEGQRDFAENYVQELVDKNQQLPPDIRWHFIGHLQTNKVKYIAPFVTMIHSVDSLKLLVEINKQALKNSRIINCLLQIHIAMEETKFGLSPDELKELLHSDQLSFLKNIKLNGLMGMASFSDDVTIVRDEFRQLKMLYKAVKKEFNLSWTILSMGMSADYNIAIEEGSTLVRIGSLLFGERAKK